MKIPKKIYLISISFFIALLVFSCLKRDNKNKLYFEISETQLYAPQKVTGLAVNILANTDWETILKPDWIQVISEENDKLLLTVLENEDYSLREGKIKIKANNSVYEINIYQASLHENFEKCYVTFDPKGHKGNHLFKVYTQSQTNPNYYWGFTIANERDLSDKTYSNQYRIISCEEYIYNGDAMLPTGSKLLYLGESEFTYKRLGASDLTGGYHGREIFSEVNFLIDGVLLDDITTGFTMRSCEKFTYTQKSSMHRDDSVHTEDAEHIKITKISDGGYFTKNTITAKNVIPINTCFGSIASISIDVAQQGFTSNPENVIIFNRDGKRKLEGYNDTLFMWNDTNKLSVNIKSTFSFYNKYATQCIWDKQYYGKYYRFFQNTNLEIGESWVFETKVTFDKL